MEPLMKSHFCGSFQILLLWVKLLRIHAKSMSPPLRSFSIPCPDVNFSATIPVPSRPYRGIQMNRRGYFFHVGQNRVCDETERERGPGA